LVFILLYLAYNNYLRAQQEGETWRQRGTGGKVAAPVARDVLNPTELKFFNFPVETIAR